jgi:hypothetical protein
VPPIKSIAVKLGGHLVMALLTVAFAAAAGEAVLRLKNSSQENYVIEMWRYAKELKVVSQDPALGHVHTPNSSAQLQNIEVKINSLGMRGPEPDLKDPGRTNVLLLGSSITLGWGVSEDETMRSRLESKLGADYQVLNGGIGNYNAERTIKHFSAVWADKVKPKAVVLHYFVNDAEALPPSVDRALIRNSQLAVTLYHLGKSYIDGQHGIEDLEEHYRTVYQPASKNFLEMQQSLDALSALAEKHSFKVILAMIPDVHQLTPYKFGFVHEIMEKEAQKRGWAYVDFLDRLSAFKGPELWTIPGDPHPNGFVHNVMAEMLVTPIRSALSKE